MELILTATLHGPWTLMLTPPARHAAATNVARSHQLQVLAATPEDRRGVIASYRMGLVLEAQLISSLKRRNGAEGTQRSTAATSTSHQMARRQTRRGGDTPSVNPKVFSQKIAFAFARNPHTSCVCARRPKPSFALVYPRPNHQTEKNPEQFLRRSQQAHSIPKLLSWGGGMEALKEAAQASPLTRILAGA
jgi:hypothetical protein